MTPLLFAQESPTETVAQPEDILSGLPHGEFWLDYLLVAVVLAAAVFVVCRSGRRV